MPQQPTVLALGKDARTDAMVAACQRSPMRPRLFGLAEMRNPGLVEKCEDVRVVSSLTDASAIAFIRELQPDLVLIGPEEPLAAGLVDELESMGIYAFGPRQQLARVESSKSWARELLMHHGIPGNPDFRVFTETDGLADYISDLGSFVIKPDGLTAGKGVRVSGDHLKSTEEGLAYAEELLRKDGRVQVEEKLEGQEFSLQTLTDGEAVVHFPVVQDHKRAFAGDRGPNTGGMGSYSDADHLLPFLEATDVHDAHSISERVIEALANETGQPYRGVLYGGFIATAEGVQLIEYNARFGDPEAMNVLPLVETDFLELAFATARGGLGRCPVEFAECATVCKYVVPEDYPNPSVPGPIEAPELSEGTHWFWAACEQTDEGNRTASSRSAAAVGIGNTLEEAERRAEAAAEEAKGRLRHRSDIGKPEAIDARVEHMKQLRASSRSRVPSHSV